VRVLDGGLPKWRAEGHPVESAPAKQPLPRTFIPSARPEGGADLDAVRAALAAGDQVLDARAADRFDGRAPEPRAGLRAGHMPGALNLPFPGILNPDGTMKQGEALSQAFRAAGVDLDRPVVTTCGSGVTACVLALGLVEAGFPEPAIYDGSWTEWALRPETEKVTR
jgi:thiosulfate/3-mercaptopyruvate sulfurtransferase